MLAHVPPVAVRVKVLKLTVTTPLALVLRWSAVWTTMWLPSVAWRLKLPVSWSVPVSQNVPSAVMSTHA